MTNQNKPHGSIPSTWQLRTYDVWGNAKDGYEVNDVYSAGEVTLRIPQTLHNVGSGMEFLSAGPVINHVATWITGLIADGCQLFWLWFRVRVLRRRG